MGSMRGIMNMAVRIGMNGAWDVVFSRTGGPTKKWTGIHDPDQRRHYPQPGNRDIGVMTMDYLRTVKIMVIDTIRFWIPVIAVSMLFGLPIALLLFMAKAVMESALGYAVIQLCLAGVLVIGVGGITIWIYFEIRKAFVETLKRVREDKES
jgi:hypothetical protein